MIVKNESHIIKKTLENLCSKIEFSYWVICDTGSTDNTREIIIEFFKTMNIPGELHKDEWQDFAHNRTVALQKAFGKTDLLLVFDADDEIVGSPELPGVNATIYDEYHLKFGSPLGTAYIRVLLVNNKKRFVYQSVIHEYIVCVEPANVPRTGAVIEGDYYIVSGRSGNRSLDPEKYLKDAKILEAAHAEAVLKNDPLFKRYAFYCANSYKDYGSLEDAIKWYKITLSQENWAQEHYMSCFHIFECYQKLNQTEQGFFYLGKAFKYDQERVECLYPLLVHYCCEGQYKMAYNYYLQVKDFYETKYLSTNVDGKLFVSIDKYNFFVPYYMILIADKMEDFDCVIKMFEIVFTKKMPVADDYYVGNILFNLQFFVKHVKSENMTQFINLANEYIRFLFDLGLQLQRHEFLREYETRFGIDVSYIFSNLVLKNKMNFSKEECKKSKNILIYTGYANVEWNYSYLKNNALGGSEKAVAYLSKELASLLESKEYNVYVAGVVQSESFDNVTYVKLQDIPNLIKSIPFNTVICSRYISFLEIYQECAFDKFYIWAHDIVLLYYGCNLSDKQIITKWDKYITGCICQTEWHANLFKDLYPELTNKIIAINNGLDKNTFLNGSQTMALNSCKKQSNKFIYSSRPERGLDTLLQLWPQILDVLPDAELVLATYGSPPDQPIIDIINKYSSSIKYLGKLNTEDLYKEMKTAEYWLYPTKFTETSCITGMEMLMSEVICLYYPVAGLINTMDKYGIQIAPGNEIETLLNLTVKQKHDLKINGKKYALTCSWENRAKEWANVIFSGERGEPKKQEEIIKPKWCFYYQNFTIETISQFIENQFNYNSSVYEIIITNNKDDIINSQPHKVTFIHLLFDESILQNLNCNNCEFSILQTEPLNLPWRLNSILEFYKKIPQLKIYDYSKSNIKILNQYNITNCEYLSYNIHSDERNKLISFMNENKNNQIYDFGFIYNWKSLPLEKQDIIDPPRRRNVVDFLKKNGFNVNIVAGYGEDRDSELGKCKIILNIHGQINENPNPSPDECSNIFEHIRCDRLLEAGYTILSETSYDLDTEFINKYSNLKIINYEDFFNLDVINNIFDELNVKNIYDKTQLREYSYDTYNKNKVDSDYDVENLMLHYGQLSNTDKVTHHEYHKYYEPVLKPYYNSRGSIVEIGLGTTASLPMWKDIFKHAHIYGVDIEDTYFVNDRCTVYKADQSKTDDLDRLKHLLSDKNVFFINDDGSHIPEHQILTFNTLFPILSEGGIYIIEDIETSYWTTGACYNYETRYGYKNPNSIIEIFKDAIDIINREFISDKTVLSNQILHYDYIESVTFSRNCIIIKKKYNATREYRFKMFTPIKNQPKIIDCFTFYNEINMLTYRLNLLNDVVDYFILVEANQTFVGKPKPLFYNENKHLFEKFNKKIIHIIVDLPFDNNKINIANGDQWTNEHFQRNGISQGIDKITLLDQDLIIISDVDEIPDPNTLKKLKNDKIDIEIKCLELDLYYYNLNSKIHYQWSLPKILSYKKYKELNTTCENIRKSWAEHILQGGWHLSYFGDFNFIKNKLENFSHQELNIASYTNPKKIKEKIDKCVDLFDRDDAKMSYINIKDNQYLPPLYDIYLTEFYSKPSKFKTFGFHSNQLCERGTDVAMYDYAYYNEKMYNNKSIIFYCKHNSNNDADVIKKFETQFKCYGYDKFSDIEQIIQDEHIDYFYNSKSGSISDNQLIKSCPNLIHAVFTVEPHGEKYAAISKQLSEKYNNIADFVPHMINLPKCNKNARQQFNIPSDAIVIGRYGGYYQFDIQVAHEAIKSILNTEPNLYFLFANTNVFYEHPRIIYLNKIIDLEDKVTFINTCDAMIHARSDGETFGLAVGEFSSCNKPIITCKSAMDNSHIDILGEKGIIYGSKESLIEIFKNIKNIINSRSDWNAYTEYSPENVMEKFFKVFIE
jgi:beta-1,4-mannosyl-glycoprotein beta-1,4-N-acetylglucosaminyltransferase